MAIDGDPVPLGYRFDVVWRGFHRRQVNEYVDRELRTLTADRDAATNMVCDLVRLLDETRSEVGRLRERYDRLCRVPIDPGSVSERLRRQIEFARAEASDIVTRARGRAEHLRLTAAEESERVTATAARRRKQVDEDFHAAMAVRRADALRDLREYEAARRAEADRVVAAARAAAAARIAAATSQVEALLAIRQRLAHRLHTVRGLFLRTCSLVDPSEVRGEVLAGWTGNGTDRAADRAADSA